MKTQIYWQEIQQKIVSNHSLMLFFNIFFVGQQSAMAVGDTLTDDAEESLPMDVLEAEAAPSPQEENIITLAHFQDAGFIYTEEREKNWVLFLAQSLNSTIRVREVRGDGIIITWDAIPPSDAEVISVHDLLMVSATEMSFHPSVCSLFIRSPRMLSQDSSKIQKGPTPPPPAKAKWLVISIPFDTNEELNIAMTPLLVE